MNRNTKRVVLIATLIAVAVLASGCEISPFQADCSGINQPDMGGLVCLGLNVFALSASAIAIVVALLAAASGIGK